MKELAQLMSQWHQEAIERKSSLKTLYVVTYLKLCQDRERFRPGGEEVNFIVTSYKEERKKIDRELQEIKNSIICELKSWDKECQKEHKKWQQTYSNSTKGVTDGSKTRDEDQIMLQRLRALEERTNSLQSELDALKNLKEPSRSSVMIKR